MQQILNSPVQSAAASSDATQSVAASSGADDPAQNTAVQSAAGTGGAVQNPASGASPAAGTNPSAGASPATGANSSADTANSQNTDTTSAQNSSPQTQEQLAQHLYELELQQSQTGVRQEKGGSMQNQYGVQQASAAAQNAAITQTAAAAQQATNQTAAQAPYGQPNNQAAAQMPYGQQAGQAANQASYNQQANQVPYNQQTNQAPYGQQADPTNQVPYQQLSKKEMKKLKKQAKKAKRKHSALVGFIEFVIIIAVAIGLAYFLTNYVVKPYEIPSESMEETIMVNDRVLSESVSYAFGGTPQYGDIVTFIDVENPNRTLIKRVIATAGQVVDVRDGYVYVDGKKLDEPYTQGKKSLKLSGSKEIAYPYTVPDDCIWVMGDNRTNSSDSRAFGAVPLSNITGKAFVRYWPLERISLF